MSTRVSEKKQENQILKIALFATGCAGIIAEFVLSTLATYLSGNAVFQWTLVMSFMLFAMGVGSRLSRIFQRYLLEWFIVTEFSLSIACATSAIVAYGLAAFIQPINLVIYVQGFIVGALIGLEIPLVIRINESYENLRINISNVMEKDYYGSLLGGILFAFIALPYLGLTYTPIILGSINFAVATLVLWRFIPLIKNKVTFQLLWASTFCFFIGVCVLAKPIIQYGEQSKYKDKVIFSQQTAYQKIVMTQWRQYNWLFLNGQVQFSSFDEEKYHEPLVHPAMKLSAYPKNILILGGGDGVAVREVLKSSFVEHITLVDLDSVMTNLGKTHPVLTRINQNSLNTPKIQIIHQDAMTYLKNNDTLFGVIIIDLPDPDSIDLMHVYSLDFYRLIEKHLIRGGAMVSQATSPYFSKKAFLCILKTIQASDLVTLPYHNHVPTMGEWGFVLGMRKMDISPEQLMERARNIHFNDIPTRFINQNAMMSMTFFGKGIIDQLQTVNINTHIQPVLHQYYLSGNWGVY
ncbi:MAG: polyamine aminopropyltransferase [Candidatus Magnetomorum sp.]|nr:polyamine aminopropyltransferase [Candidatus Magnetomorum sp.]